MKVGIIGSSGSMGSFFARYFVSKGFDVFGYDLNKREIEGMTQAGSLSSLVENSKIVLVAVPMEKTLKVISRLPYVRERKTLIEITSVKSGILEKILIQAKLKGYKLCSIHPLFGPSLREGRKMKLAVVGLRGRMNLNRIFPDAEFVFFKDGVDHDRAMAYVLSLTHAVSIAYSSLVLKYAKPNAFFRICTPFSSVQTALSLCVLNQDEGLVSQIQFRNPFSMEVLEELLREVAYFTKVLSSRRTETMKRYLRRIKSGQRSERLQELKNIIYDAYHEIEASSLLQ